MPYQGSRGGGKRRGSGGGGGRDGAEQDEEIGKLFVGGLSWETTQESLKGYFSRYGDVSDCVVMKNPESGRSRGFGFVTFTDPSIIDLVLRNGPHQLDNRTIDPKPCNPRSMQRSRKANSSYPKVFLGGLPSNVTETDLRNFFSRYGNVVEVVIMYDQEKKKSRGFGFLSFENEDSVDRCVQEHFVTIQGKQVEMKKAEPRDKSDGGDWNSGPMGNGVSQMPPVPSGMMHGMGYQGWGAPPGGQGYGQGYGQAQGYQGWGTPPQGQPPAQWGTGYPGQQGYGYGPQGQQGWNWNWGMPQNGPGPSGGGPPNSQDSFRNQGPGSGNEQQNSPPGGGSGQSGPSKSEYSGYHGQYGNMGNYPQESSSYGPSRGYGQEYSQGGGQQSYGDYGDYPSYGSSGHSDGPPPGPQRGGASVQPGQGSGYHPYRRS